MTASDPCQHRREAVEATLLEWQRLAETEAQAAPVVSGRPPRTMGGDLGSRLYETLGRREAAQRRYRTAVRNLSECLRAQRAGSGHA